MRTGRFLKPHQATTREVLNLDNPLWMFALSFYARDGISAGCLTLQNQLGVDVNILLFAIFAQVEHGITLDRDDLATADGLVRDWRSEIIQPLRHVRTRMKSDFPALSAATESLRNRVKAAELDAEKITLAQLFAWLNAQSVQATDAGLTANPVLTVVRYFASRPGVFLADVDAALDTLLQATLDVSATTGQRS